MVVTGAAWGQARSADVVYSFREATPVHAFRVGDECFVPLEAVDYWDWKVDRDGDSVKVEAEGKKFTVPGRNVGGKWCLALRKAVEELSAESQWLPQTDTLQVWAPIKSLSVQDGKVLATTPISIRPYAFTLASPDRMIVDLSGARLPAGFKLDLPPGSRAFQYRPNVVRVVSEVKFVPVAPDLGTTASREVSVEFKVADLPQAPVEPTVDPNAGTLPIQDLPGTTPQGPLTIVLSKETEDRTMLQFPLSGRMRGPATFNKVDPSTLEITLPFVQGTIPTDFVSPTAAVTSFEAVQKGFDTVLTLHLARPMGAEVTTSPTGVSVTLVKPEIGDGKLAGKVVIVDAGHGGHDSGAKGGGAQEKSLTLKVATLLADRLTKAGATVLMTRKTDVFIPLDVRSDIANRNHADLFISVHINSTGGSGSQSGTISFHHKNNAVGKVLAECIQAEMAKVNKLPNLGVWSDGRIYPSGGFSVLRRTKQPAAVLLELGFINHPKDRARLLTDDFQQSIASAIVRGVRRFLGDSE